MMTLDYSDKLLEAWEEVFKRGQLTLWVLLAIKRKPRYASEISDFIKAATKGVVQCEEQSLYRSLRRLYDTEIVDFETGQGSKGPDRKYYRLTELGSQLLERFLARNVRLYYRPEVERIINNKEKS